MNPTLIFVYNAHSGLFYTLTDMAHKILSPETYPCNLCALTHTNTGMRQEWRQFVESLDCAVEFLHADELKGKYGMEGISLPVIFTKEDEGVRVWIDASAINSCRTMDELKELIRDRLAGRIGHS